MQLFAITAPIFLVVVLGMLTARRHWLGDQAGPVLGNFVMRFALPATLFATLSQVPAAEIIEPAFMLAYGGSGLLTALLVIGLASLLMGRDRIQALLQGFGSIMPNTLFFGLPIAMQYFPETPGNAFAMAVLTENLLFFTPFLLALQVTAAGPGGSIRAAIRQVGVQLMRSPIILAIIAGVLVSSLAIPVPLVLAEAIDLVARASAAIALFAVGFAIARSSVKLRGQERDLILVVGAKLIVQPLITLVLVLFVVPDFDPVLQFSAVLLSSMPMFSIYPIIGARYGHERDTLLALMVAVVLSFLTITGWLWVLGQLLQV